MNQKFVWLILVAVVIVFWLISERFKTTELIAVKIGGTTIQAELADTLEKKAQGLSGRKELGENEGMLFVFDSSSTTEVVLDKPGHHGIWMKDMKFPIDILWARPVRSLARDEVASPVREFEQDSNADTDSRLGIFVLSNGTSPKDLGKATSNGVKFNLQIVDIVENISPDTYPKVFRPQKPAFYVLEVNAGFASDHNIKIGDSVESEQ